MGLESKSNQREVFKRPPDISFLDTVKGVNRAIQTLFITPDRVILHRAVRDLTVDICQPLQPPLPEMKNELHNTLIKYVDPYKKRSLRNKELIALGTVLVQFTDYIPELQPYAQTHYKQIESLYKTILEKACHSRKPLTFPEQLYLSLSQSYGDLTESLWRLFITSRLHARWFDEKAITDLPIFCREEKINRMIMWYRSLAGCKSKQPNISQDVGGDNYYAWTHALASVVYNVLPVKSTTKTRLAGKIFQNGTAIMHNVVHKYNPQAVFSNHSNAALYGNAIGEVCTEILS